MTDEPLVPSPVIESLLTGLGARPETTDAILGDLHQKLIAIAPADGARAARRWYRREALRAAPHLVRDALRRSGFAGGRRLASVALLSVTLAVMLGAMTFFPGIALMQDLSGDRLDAAPWRYVVNSFTATLLLGAPVVAGFIAASLEDEAPFLAAVTIALGWAGWVVLGLTLRAVGPLPLPGRFVWIAAINIAWVTLGAVTGGLFAIGRRSVANA